MKRFLAFQGENYYPGGGWDDFAGDYDIAEEAVAVIQAEESARVARDMASGFYTKRSPWASNWAHVIDSETGVEVWRAQ